MTPPTWRPGARRTASSPNRNYSRNHHSQEGPGARTSTEPAPGPPQERQSHHGTQRRQEQRRRQQDRRRPAPGRERKQARQHMQQMPGDVQRQLPHLPLEPHQRKAPLLGSLPGAGSSCVAVVAIRVRPSWPCETSARQFGGYDRRTRGSGHMTLQSLDCAAEHVQAIRYEPPHVEAHL
jgi:hypothetical protein